MASPTTIKAISTLALAALGALLAGSCGDTSTTSSGPGDSSATRDRESINIRLLDEPLVVEASAPSPSHYAALLAEEQVWILGEKIAAGRWKRDAANKDYERIKLMLPLAGLPLEHIAAKRLRRAGMKPGSKEQVAPAEGHYLLSQNHAMRAFGTGPAGTIEIDYPTTSAALARYAGAVDSEDRVAMSELRLGIDCRRATVFPTPSHLTYQVELPERARLDFALAASRLEMKPAADGVQLRVARVGSPRFKLSLELEDGTLEVLWEDELSPKQRERYVDVSLDLAAWSGQLVRLHLETAAPTAPASAGWDSFCYWAEPLIWSAQPSDKPNVVVLLLDTLRADRLGCYGWERARTPRLDEIAQRGVLFEDAMSAASWTLPAHASLFTSTYPSQHGLWNNERLPDSLDTLAEALGDSGYRTGAFTERGYLKAEHGFARGFERFDSDRREPEQTFGKALGWIEQRTTPFFTFVHTYKVHSPYDPAEEFTEGIVREYSGDLPAAVTVKDYDWGTGGPPPSQADIDYISDLYDAEIAELDVAVGQFIDRLEALGMLDNTLLIITSDHGEEFFEHGGAVHGKSLYQEQLHVPMIVYWKGHFEGGQVLDHTVHLIDVAPTVAAAAGVSMPQTWVGLPLGLSEPGLGRPLFTPTMTRWSGDEFRGKQAIALRDGSLKYVDYPRGIRRHDAIKGPALFDLETDPHEQHNLLDAISAAEWAEKAAALRRHFYQVSEVHSVESDAESLKELERLGYVGAE